MKGTFCRRRAAGVADVLGNFLLVAIVVVLAVVLYAVVSNAMQPVPQSLTLFVSQGPVTTNATNATLNDTYLEVEQRLGQGDVLWNDSTFQITITTPSGTLLTGHNISIIDLTGDGRAGGGDRVAVRGMTGAYHGAMFHMYFRNRLVCELTLP